MCCDGIKNVSVSDIALTSNISVYTKIKTSDIHEVMIQSAYNLITEETPNYQWVASRLRNFALRKEVWGNEEAPKLWDCDFGTGTPITSNCYGGNGNNTGSLSNYGDIPAEYVNP